MSDSWSTVRSHAERVKLPHIERVDAVLAFVFGGVHNAPPLRWNGFTDWPSYSVVHYGSLDTFDFDRLTRLVIAAHDQCIRCEVESAGPRRVAIVLYPRHLREGGMSKRHPTMDKAPAMLAERNIWHPRSPAPSAEKGEGHGE